MVILVTGGAGYIGSVVIEYLQRAGHDVIVFDNLSTGNRKAVDCPFIERDLAFNDSILAAFDWCAPDAVVHLAAEGLVTAPAEKVYRTNVVGGLNLLNAMRQAGVYRIVFSSSCATYGLSDRALTVKSPQQPVSAYAETKLAFERALHWYGLRSTVFRFFNVAGATERHGEWHQPETHLIPVLLEGGEFSLYGTDYPTHDGTCIRDYVDVRDVARAIVDALEHDRLGTFNLGTGHGYSVREVIQTVERVTGRSIRVKEYPRRPGDAYRLVAAPDWTTRYNLEDMVRSAWAWRESHPKGYE